MAGAVVGSLAFGDGDRFSDLDLTFGITDGVPIGEVLDDWARALMDELDAVRLLDLERSPTIYRVFLLPGSLQLDLSMTPAGHFRPAGPRFRLLFGEKAPADGRAAESAGAGPLFIPMPALPNDIFGWGIIYALHARACIERRRLWQAEHYVGAVRDHALSLACIRAGVTVAQARGYDDLSPETLARFDATRIGALEPELLRAALVASVAALMYEARAAQLPLEAPVGRRLVGWLD